MGINTTIGELLLPLIAMCNESVVCEASIVGMIVFNGDMVVDCELLECQFCLEGFVAWQICHHMYVSKSWKMINEDGGCLVTLIDQLALELRYETWLCWDHLINGNNLPWLGRLEHMFDIGVAFCLPWNLCHGTKKATSASWWRRFCQLLWYLAIFCQLFYLIKWQVTQVEMPSLQLSLIILRWHAEFMQIFILKWWGWR